MSTATLPTDPDAKRPLWVRSAAAWLASNRLGLAVMALVVGAGAGLGAAGFRWLIFTFTWLVTGHNEFGQQGHAPSLHLPWLGIWFVLVVPVLGGLIYGPLIQRFAREARGHGVPEVMLAVAENGAGSVPRSPLSRRWPPRSRSPWGAPSDARDRSSRSGRRWPPPSGRAYACPKVGCGSSSPAVRREGSQRRSTRRSPVCSSALRSCCASSPWTLCSPRAWPRSRARSSAAHSSAQRPSST